MHSIRQAPDAETAGRQIEERLVSLSRAHDLLTQDYWNGADIQEMVARALEPFSTWAGSIEASGEPARLGPQQTLAFSLALHELATNAVKYGALSQPGGRVRVAWTCEAAGERRTLRFSWRESGGPPVSPPQRRGFGSRLLERGLAGDLNGSAKLTYATTGVEFDAVAEL